MDRESYTFLRDVVRRHSGIHLTDREAGVLETRVQRRLRALGLATAAEYATYLRGPEGPGEIPALLDAVTVNYTFFFRENRQFQFLSAEVLPALLSRPDSLDREAIRVWSAGCSSGEEPYSIAICFVEAAGSAERCRLQLLASDLNRRALQTATRGIYPLDRLTAFPPEYRYKYLVRDAETPEGCLRLTGEIRRLVTFRRSNILSRVQPFRGDLDLIFCRNVMLYFDEGTRRRLLGSFRRGLRPGGHLFLGETETPSPAAGAGFDRVGPGVFRKV